MVWPFHVSPPAWGSLPSPAPDDAALRLFRDGHSGIQHSSSKGLGPQGEHWSDGLSMQAVPWMALGCA